MPIYKVTTEGDEEARTTEVLGYVDATSPEHAAKHLYSLGILPYYQYTVREVANPIFTAWDNDRFSHLIVDSRPSVEEGVTYINTWKREDPTTRLRKLKAKIEATGLSREDIEEYLKMSVNNICGKE